MNGGARFKYRFLGVGTILDPYKLFMQGNCLLGPLSYRANSYQQST